MHTFSDEDRQIVNLARTGDLAALESLFEKYQDRVFGLAMQIVQQTQDAEEVLQQTFLKVVEHIDELRDDVRFTAWLMRIATNQALSLLRLRASSPNVQLVEGEHDSSCLPNSARDNYVTQKTLARWQDTPDRIAARREIGQKLAKTISSLDPKYSLVLMLRDFEGLSTQETAEALQISPGNVKARLLRAKKMLRKRLGQEFALQ